MEQATKMDVPQNMPNGHDEHKLTSPFTNQSSRTAPDKTKAEPTVNGSGNPQQLNFEDNFAEQNLYNDNSDDEDNFVDAVELARIRQLSIIHEGAAEYSDPTTEEEEDNDYIRLDLMRESDIHSAPPNGSVERPEHTVQSNDNAYVNVDPKDNSMSVQGIGSELPVCPETENANLRSLELTNDITCESTNQDNQATDPQTPVGGTDGFLDMLSNALSSGPTMNDSLEPQGDVPLPIVQFLPTNTLSDAWLTASDQVCPLPNAPVMSMDDFLNLKFDSPPLPYVSDMLPNVTPLDQLDINSLGSELSVNMGLTDLDFGIDSQLMRSTITIPGSPNSVQVECCPENDYVELAGVAVSNGETAPSIRDGGDKEGEDGDTRQCAVLATAADVPPTPVNISNVSTGGACDPAASQGDDPLKDNSGPTDGSNRRDFPNSSNLDKGIRSEDPQSSPHNQSGDNTPVMLRHSAGVNSSDINKRKDVISTPVLQRRDRDEELGVLQPLSPDHGQHINEQYDYMRRTLSHSHRRFSTRRRPNRKTVEVSTVGQNGVGFENFVPFQGEVGGRSKDIVLTSEAQTRTSNAGFETHVDQHGRTYYMDHITHTIAFNSGEQARVGHSRAGDSAELDARREMLERRYLSLQRSFRRSSAARPNVPRRNQRAEIPSSTSTLQDNMSLTLTREEADAMSNRDGQAAAGQAASRSKSKKKRSSTGSSRKWLFGRKSSKKIVQQISPRSGEDDFLPVFSPPPSTTDTHFTTLDFNASPRGIESHNSSELELSVTMSLGSSIFSSESHTDNEVEGTLDSTSGGEVREDNTLVSSVDASRPESDVERRTMSPEIAELGRQNSIVRSSVISEADQRAAHTARERTSTRGHVRRDTDEYTNDELPNERRSTVIVPTEEEGDRQEDSQVATTTEAVGNDESEDVDKGPISLIDCPALKFITRKDLYSFLNSAGKPGKEFLACRPLMQLVQRIRSDNQLFNKYQHSRHLVTALNKFVDDGADLPDKWEKKLNKQGNVFFIDHDNRITTFIDPRLPLPDQEFTYTTRENRHSMSISRTSVLYADEPDVRPHHTTTGVRTSSVSSVDGTIPTPPSADVADSSVSSVVSHSDSDPPSYEDQVVAFFRQPDVVEQINIRYQRGVKPQFRNIIEEICLLGNPALQRIQLSGSIAAYELALVLSLFEEDIGLIQVNSQPVAPLIIVNPPQPQRQASGINSNSNKSTLQRTKEAFSTKLQHFKIMMVRMGFAQGSRLKFNIRRDHLLEDAYEHIMKSDIKQLQTKRLNIAFKGEDGLDYGGPSREFFFLLSREIFNPYYGLFEYSANDTYTVQISTTSEFLQNNLDWFRFAGRVLALVVIQGFLLDAFFTRTVYKAILSRIPTLKDLEALEPSFYNSLLWIQDNDPEPLDLTFTVEEEAFGQLTGHELKPGGLDLLVTEDNKDEYVHLMLQWRLDHGVAKQMEVVKKGFSELLPPHLLADFDAHELEFITAGTVEIDVEDWRQHTEYRNGYHPGHPVIMWFWQAVEAFDNEQRLRLLQFVTGTSSVPFEGFKALRGSNGPKRFTIDYYNEMKAFPRTHTCFNRIDLPPYSSYQTLFEKLLFATQEGGGFGIE